MTDPIPAAPPPMMNVSTPMQPIPPPPGASPSNSTTLTAMGGALAAVTMAILGANHVTFPAGIESALAVIFATICGYFPASGRK
jgi:hypothetical protein